MSNVENIRIGVRLKHARKVKKKSLKQLAIEVGCSESLLSKIENGHTQPSLHTLHKLAHTLNTSIAKLFEEVGTDSLKFVLRSADRATLLLEQCTENSNGIHLESIIPHPNPQLLTANIHVVQPNGGSGGREPDGEGKIATIEHEGEEIGYILSGTLEITIDKNTFLLHQGDSFFLESHLQHGYRNPGETEARVLWICTPPTF